jgi:hypothetical protein
MSKRLTVNFPPDAAGGPEWEKLRSTATPGIGVLESDGTENPVKA